MSNRVLNGPVRCFARLRDAVDFYQSRRNVHGRHLQSSVLAFPTSPLVHQGLSPPGTSQTQKAITPGSRACRYGQATHPGGFIMLLLQRACPGFRQQFRAFPRFSGHSEAKIIPCLTRSVSSNSRWKQRQGKDTFAREARVQGLKSRAAFKLLEVALATTSYHPTCADNFSRWTRSTGYSREDKPWWIWQVNERRARHKSMGF